MAHHKQASQSGKTLTTSAGVLRRARGDRPSVQDARRMAFIKQVVSMQLTDELLRDAETLVREVRAASSASFLERYRQAR